MFLNKELKLIVGAKKSFSKKLLGQENHSCIVFLAAKIWKIWKTICSSSYILSVCSLHKMFWKMSKNYRKTLVLESLFNKVLVLQRYRLLNFLWRNILRDLILVSSVNFCVRVSAQIVQYPWNYLFKKRSFKHLC